MKDLRRASILVAILAGTGGSVATLMVGCSNDEAGIAGDASTDGTVDGRSPEAGHPDVTRPRDGGRDSGRDSGARDSGIDTGVDSGFDSGHDSGQDSAQEAGKDSGVDAVPDTGTSVDAEPLIAAYPTQVTTAYCQHLAGCCNSPSTFSVASCVEELSTPGIAGALSNVGLLVPNSGHLTISQAAVTNCLTAIDLLPCTAYSSQQYIQAVTACAGAVKGTLAVGQTGCLSSWDCVQPAFCNTLTDAGAPADGGTCSALRPAGQPCTDPNFSTDCSSLGDVPGAFCGPFGATPPTCLPSVPVGNLCEEALQCDSLICGVGNVCAGGEPFAGDGGICSYFPPKDGG